MKKSVRALIMVPLVIFTLGTVSCEELLSCLCGTRFDDPQVDAFFTASEDLLAASQLVEARLDGALLDLAVELGLDRAAIEAGLRSDRSATLSQISGALCDVFASVGITVSIEAEPPQCHASADVTARAVAECEATVDPGSVEVRCHGTCEGTCRAGCTGECRMPSVSAYCEGTCHGECSIESSTTCSGICHGSCSGACSYEEGGQCAGSCEGTCSGRCETRVEGDCSGECSGQCSVVADPGGCNGQCEGECQGHCEGECYGEIEPPSVTAECEAQVEARVEASVECEPGKIDYGADVTGISNIAQISYYLGEIRAATEEATKVTTALNAYVTTLGSLGEAFFEGEIGAKDAACAIQRIDDAASALGAAVTTLGEIAGAWIHISTCA